MTVARESHDIPRDIRAVSSSRWSLPVSISVSKLAARMSAPIESLSIRFALWMIAVLPESLGYAIARLLIYMVDMAMPKWRQVGRQHLELAGIREQGPVLRELWRTIARFGLFFAHLPALRSHRLGRWMRVEGLEHYREAKQSGHGVILASAHIGNWELSALISVLAGETCYVFALPLLDAQLDAIVNARRMALGNQVLKDVRGVFRVLTEGGLVALLADGKPVVGPGVPLKFLGQSITVSTAVVRLAGQTGASILPMFALWSDVEHRWVVTIHPLLTLTGDADHDTRQLHARMEAVIRKHPGQYFWILPL